MALLRRLTNLFRGGRLAREIQAELEAHTAMRTEDNIAEGHVAVNHAVDLAQGANGHAGWTPSRPFAEQDYCPSG